jgi:hypothetical protein
MVYGVWQKINHGKVNIEIEEFLGFMNFVKKNNVFLDKYQMKKKI